MGDINEISSTMINPENMEEEEDFSVHEIYEEEPDDYIDDYIHEEEPDDCIHEEEPDDCIHEEEPDDCIHEEEPDIHKSKDDSIYKQDIANKLTESESKLKAYIDKVDDENVKQHAQKLLSITENIYKCMEMHGLENDMAVLENMVNIFSKSADDVINNTYEKDTNGENEDEEDEEDDEYEEGNSLYENSIALNEAEYDNAHSLYDTYEQDNAEKDLDEDEELPELVEKFDKDYKPTLSINESNLLGKTSIDYSYKHNFKSSDKSYLSGMYSYPSNLSDYIYNYPYPSAYHHPYNSYKSQNDKNDKIEKKDKMKPTDLILEEEEIHSDEDESEGEDNNENKVENKKSASKQENSENEELDEEFESDEECDEDDIEISSDKKNINGSSDCEGEFIKKLVEHLESDENFYENIEIGPVKPIVCKGEKHDELNETDDELDEMDNELDDELDDKVEDKPQKKRISSKKSSPNNNKNIKILSPKKKKPLFRLNPLIVNHMQKIKKKRDESEDLSYNKNCDPITMAFLDEFGGCLLDENDSKKPKKTIYDMKDPNTVRLEKFDEEYKKMDQKVRDSPSTYQYAIRKRRVLSSSSESTAYADLDSSILFAKFYKISNELSNTTNQQYIDKFIQKYKRTIFSPTNINEKKQTIIQNLLSNGSINIAMKLLTHPSCNYVDYIINSDKDYMTFIDTLIKYNSEAFNAMIDSKSYEKNSVLHEHLYSYTPKYAFVIIRYGRPISLKKFMNAMCSDKNFSVNSPSKLYQMADSNGGNYSGYSVLSFLLENKDSRFSCGTKCGVVLSELLQSNWFTNEALLSMVSSLFENGYTSLMLVLSTILNSEQMYVLSKKILSTSQYYSTKCLLNMTTDKLIESKELADEVGINRLSFLVKNSDDITVHRLLTSRNFTKEEYMKLDNNGMNCILFTLKYKPSLIKIIISSDYFEESMVRVVDDDGVGLKHYIKAYCPNDKVAKTLYKMYFPKSDIVSDDYSGEIMCPLCMEYKINIRLHDCGHTMCSQCITDKLVECPYCFATILDFQHIIFS